MTTARTLSWQTKRFKYLVAWQKGKQPAGLSDSPDNGERLPYLTMDYLRGEASASTLYARPESNSVVADDNDIILLWDGANAGEFLVGKRGLVSSTAALLKPRLVQQQFLFYACQAAQSRLQQMTVGMGIPHVNGDSLGQMLFSIPSTSEQRRIATYLDEQTAKIDRLMDMRRRQMALLKEQRAALIQQAVTRGLNPNAPMKDSGLPWLGEIPAHWKMKRFHHSIAFKEGPGIMAVDFHEEGVPLIRISNLRPDGLDWSERTCLDQKLASTKWAHFRVRPGDLLISSSASMGLVSEVDEASNGAIPYTGIIRLRSASPGLTKQFIKLFVGSGLFATQISMFQTGSTIQHFGPLHLRQMFLAIPPVAEQEGIIEYVQQESTRREQLISAYTRQLELLTEYRAALIHECVTGQRKIGD